MPKLFIEGIFMHFPVADSIDGADANFTHTQFERFTQMLSALKGEGIEPGADWLREQTKAWNA